MDKTRLALHRELMLDIWSPAISNNPLEFVKYVFPWGKVGSPLEHFTGPKKWQEEMLLEMAEHINRNIEAHSNNLPLSVLQEAIASGRGIGKSVLVAWIVLWFLSTRIGGTVIVSANSEAQLKSVTWGELSKWHSLMINKEWFDLSATRLVPAPWFANLIETQLHKGTRYYYAEGKLWSEETPDNYAGAHSQDGMIVIFDEACHDDKTDVLTKRGWVNWSEVTMEDEFLTMNPDSHIVEYQKPIRLHKFYRNDVMYHYKVRGADICVTPNHEMYYTTRKLQGKFKKKRIDEIKSENCYFKRGLDWTAIDVKYHTIPVLKTRNKLFTEKILDMDLWLEFLGWYMSEGHLITNKGKIVSTAITNQDLNVIKRCEYLATELGYSPKIYSSGRNNGYAVTIHNSQLARHLSEAGIGCKVKRIPDYVRFLSKRQIRIYLDAHRKGDGYLKQKTEIIYTSSKNLADDLHELYLKIGMRCSLLERKISGDKKWILDHFATSSCNGYIVSASEIDMLKFKERCIEKVKYEGFVYCAEIPNHLLYTRRNGFGVWSGNSGIPQSIWDVTKGYFTDNTVHRYWFAFSNPRNPDGAFFECFHSKRNFWKTKNIDARDVEGTDKEIYKQIIEEWGEDSRQAKIEVYGKFPDIGDNQFIDLHTVNNAMKRERYNDETAPIVIGVDVARFGSDKTCIVVRKGRDIVEIKKWSGIDTMQTVGHTILAIEKWKPALVCIDEGGLGAGVVDRLKEQRYKVRGVNFGYKSGKKEYVNKRTEMWADMKEWLKSASVPEDRELRSDLIGPTYKASSTGAIQLERKEDMKRRGIASPDSADALCLSFAFPVPKNYTISVKPEEDEPNYRYSSGNWMSY